MRNTKLRGLLLAAVLTLLLAACGGGEEEADITTDDTAGEQTTEEMTSESEMESESEMMTESELSSESEMSSESETASAEACTTEEIVAAVEGASEEGTLEGMTDDPVGTAASNNPVLTTLTTAVQEAELVDTLNNAEALTVFAPTDCAFAQMDQETLDAALADPTGLLAQVLGFHVVPGEQLSAEQLAGMSELETFNGTTLPISAEGETITLNDGQAEVVVPDVQTANATVHLIDAVMLPPSE